MEQYLKCSMPYVNLVYIQQIIISLICYNVFDYINVVEKVNLIIVKKNSSKASKLLFQSHMQEVVHLTKRENTIHTST